MSFGAGRSQKNQSHCYLPGSRKAPIRRDDLTVCDPRGQTAPSAFEVLDSVNAGERRILSHCDGDGVAVPQRAQLLERLELLERRAFEPRIGAQEIGAIGINADVPIAGSPSGRTRVEASKASRAQGTGARLK